MITVSILTFMIISFVNTNNSHPKATAKKNAINIGMVAPGLTYQNVVEIMGEPERIILQPFNNQEIELEYLSPSGYSDEFRVFISRDDKLVIRVADGL